MITLRQAQAVVSAGEAKAATIGVPVIVAVLDSGTHLKAFARMDGAVLGSIDIAKRKAHTAVLFQANSEAVWDYCKPGASAHARARPCARQGVQAGRGRDRHRQGRP